MGVFPPETIFASVGLFMTSLTLHFAFSFKCFDEDDISTGFFECNRSTRALSMPRPVLLSVRAMIKKSSFVLVSTATLPPRPCHRSGLPVFREYARISLDILDPLFEWLIHQDFYML